METAIAFLTLAGMAYAAYRLMKWMLRTGQTQGRRDETLSPRDLRVLEETAQQLMDELRTLTQECVERIERAIADAELAVGQLDRASHTERPTVPAASISLAGEAQLIDNLRRMGIDQPQDDSTAANPSFVDVSA